MYLEYSMFSTVVDPTETTQDCGDLMVLPILLLTMNNDFESGFKILSHQHYASSLSASSSYYPFFLFPVWKSSIFYILPHSQASLSATIPVSWKNFASLQLISGKQNQGLPALSFHSDLVLAVTTVCEPSKH